MPGHVRSGLGLRLENVSKTFSSRVVLRSFDMTVAPGEVHGLVGQNGSGKSTLIKILAGYHRPDRGAIASMDGATFDLGAVPADLGVNLRFVHQDLALVLELNAMDNVALGGGYAKRGLGWIDWHGQSKLTEAALRRFGVEIDLQLPLSALAPVERTAVAIVRALAGWQESTGVLVLDEPTASLPASEVQRLHSIVREVANAGAGVIYVSHRLDDVVEVAHRISVLRDGDLVGTYASDQVDSSRLATLMVGHVVNQERHATPVPVGNRQPVLSARGLAARWLSGVDLDLYPGEIVGISGVLGSGREELPYALASALVGSSGEIRVDGNLIPHKSPRDAQEAGIGFVPADRLREAVIAPFSVQENLTLTGLRQLSAATVIRRENEDALVDHWMSKVDVKPHNPEVPLPSLSGGNQQKVILARVLSTSPMILIMSEPTAGVDVGAREALYEVLRTEVAERGLAVVVASSDIQDLVALCHRVIVIRAGKVECELSGDAVTTASILHASEGAASPDAYEPRSN